MKGFLNQILQSKRLEVEQLKQSYRQRSLIKSLSLTNQVSIIAEIKKGSPSKGLFAPELDIAHQAKIYEKLGARAISVLTDSKYFYGSFDYLKAVREVTDLPLLCKDFIIDKIQIEKAKASGADAVLLIVGALSKPQLDELYCFAKNLGLEVLVEVHDEQQLTVAQELGAKLIGINNRDLQTFVTDINRTLSLAHLVRKQDIVLVSESGIGTRKDVEKLVEVGVTSILVGESLVIADDIEEKFSQLMIEV